MMKTIRTALAIAALSTVALPALAAPNDPKLSGTHYNLNVQGKSTCAGDNLTGSDRHTIQVLLNYSDKNYNGAPVAELDRRNKIFLSAGDFQVLDGNACDGDGAKFQLPGDVATNWEIWARALAKPGGSATVTTCLVDETSTIYCNTESDDLVTLKRTTGKPQWQNVTKQLTSIYYCTDVNGDGAIDAATECGYVNVLGSETYQYFWDYDNAGLRLAQLRFYPKP